MAKATELRETEQLVKDIEALEKEVDRLRFLYEQYFLGLDREEPWKQREKVVEMIRKFTGLAIRNAGTKFRLQQAISKYNTYGPYWDRILREIDEGKYKRDVFRASLKSVSTQPKESLSKEKQQPPSTQPKDSLTLLFEHYIVMRQKCNESVAGLTMDGFRKSMATQVEVIRKKSKATSLKFKVVIENGKAKIKIVAGQPSINKG